MEKKKLDSLIAGCMKNNRVSQKELYVAFYGFAMNICLRYANNRDDAAKIMNEGFLKVFNSIAGFKSEDSLRVFISAIMVTTSIKYYRSSLNMEIVNHCDDLVDTQFLSSNETVNINVPEQSRCPLIRMLRRLPLPYRMVFNLFAIDGFSHEEIALLLNVAPADSQSYLLKARKKLKEFLLDDATIKT